MERIGIDEISYKRGHKYLTIVVDHDSGRLLWAAVGRDKATLDGFFKLLGPERCALMTHVSADAAPWIAKSVTEHCPEAVQCADPFHVVAWATDALDDLRRQAWNDARALARTETKRNRGRPRADEAPRPGHDRARALKGARYALWKNPENLTENQQDKLAWVAKTDPRLHRGYLLKEGLRYVFQVKGQAGKAALDRWLSWAQRCRIPAFVELGRKIRRHRPAINATSNTDSPTPSSSPPTPRSASSPASPTGSNHPKPSSPSPSYHSAATAQTSPDEAPHDPHNQQERRKSTPALGAHLRERGHRDEVEAVIDDHFEDLAQATCVRRAAQLLGRPRASHYRRIEGPTLGPKKPRPAPVNALTEPERQHVLSVLRSPEFCDLAPAQVWARLLDDGTYLCSISTMYRLLAAAGRTVNDAANAPTPPRNAPSSSPRRPIGYGVGTSSATRRS